MGNTTRRGLVGGIRGSDGAADKGCNDAGNGPPHKGGPTHAGGGRVSRWDIHAEKAYAEAEHGEKDLYDERHEDAGKNGLPRPSGECRRGSGRCASHVSPP